METYTPTTIKKESELDPENPEKPPTDTHELYKCATSEPEPYECQGCGSFKTTFCVQLQQHIRQNHTNQITNQFKLHNCANCNFETYSKYASIRHKLFIRCAPKSGYKRRNNVFHCEFCKYKVKQKKNLLRHLDQNHNEWHRCEKCPFVTKRKGLLQKHKWTHSEWQTCDKCPYQARTAQLMKQHEVMKHSSCGNWYQCGHCPHKCVSLLLLQQHQKSKHKCTQLHYQIIEMGVNSNPIEWFQCGVCSFKSRGKGDIRKHNLDKHGLINANDLFVCTKRLAEWYTCAKCDNFKSNFCTDLKKHVRDRHSSKYPEKNKMYKCQRCRFTTYSRYLDLRHGLFEGCVPVHEDEEDTQIYSIKRTFKYNTSEHEETGFWYYCKQCPFKSRKEGGLNQHMVYHGKQHFHCKYCKFKALQKSDLQTHVVQHINDDITYFHCAHCPFKTLFKGNLQKHVQKHSSHWMRCSKCLFKTKYAYNLTLHEKLVHGLDVKWFDCDLCEFRTKRLYNLKLHKKVKHVTADKETKKSNTQKVKKEETNAKETNEKESNENLYQCDQCSFKTKVKASLRTHQQVHSEKKYTCKYCDHTSKRMYNLKTHILQKHADPNNIEWLHCEQCEFRSKTKSILKRHIQERHSNEWVYCARCHYKAKSKRLLISHLRVVHNCGKRLAILRCEHCPYVGKNASQMWHHKWKHQPQIVGNE